LILAAFGGVTPRKRCAASLCTLCLAKRHAQHTQNGADKVRQALLLRKFDLSSAGAGPINPSHKKAKDYKDYNGSKYRQGKQEQWGQHG
jgi:hypothetical protein